MTGPSPMSPHLKHVEVVIRGRPLRKMFWIHTQTNIARMHGMHSRKNISTKFRHEGYSVGTVSLAVVTKCSVPIGPNRPLPYLAINRVPIVVSR